MEILPKSASERNGECLPLSVAEDMLSNYLSRLPKPIELRILYTRKGTISGYYDDIDTLVSDIELLSSNEEKLGVFSAIYTTVNALHPDLLARSYNRVGMYAKHTTSDQEVVRRRFLLLDVDPQRPAGISSTDEEHESALYRVREVCEYLTDQGFPDGIVGDSGNGGHAMFAVDHPNSEDVRDTYKLFLDCLARRFDTEDVHLDRTVFNAARIWKCYGTPARKGHEVGKRQHRLARVISQPQELVEVELGLIKKVIEANLPTTTVSAPTKLPTKDVSTPHERDTSESESWVELFFDRHEIDVKRGPTPYDNGTKWLLEACPLCGESDNSAVVMVKSDGKICYKCHHNRCADNGWQDFRSHFEPDRNRSKAQNDKPTVFVNGGQLCDLVDETIAAIHQANDPPRLFLRGGSICRLRLNDETQSPIAEPLSDGALLDALSRVAVWRKHLKDDKSTDASVPKEVRQVILNKTDLDLPVLRSIVETPAFAKDGRLLVDPGYDQRSETWLAENDTLAVPKVPERPTDQDVSQAKALLLEDLFADFPFANAASRANTLGLFLLPFVRQMIDGPTPLHLIDAPTEGTGKGLLARCFSLIATGRDERVASECRGDDEWNKTLTSLLLQGPVYVLLDNISRPLHSASFAAVLTARTHQSRLLGVNKMIELPVDCAWLATGNNVHASKEIARRIVRIRLDSELEHPHLRKNFKHEDLEGWVKRHRADLVWAALTLCQAWIAAGRPKGSYTKGSYSSWATTIGGILDVAGIGNFMANESDLFSEVNSTAGEWREFVQRWWAIHRDRPVSAKELHALACREELLETVFDEKNTSRILAYALSNQLHKVYGDFRIERDGTDANKCHLYRLNRIDSGDAEDKPSEDKPAQPCGLSRQEETGSQPGWSILSEIEMLTLHNRQEGPGYICEPVYRPDRKVTGKYRVARTWPGMRAGMYDKIHWEDEVDGREGVKQWVDEHCKR